MRAATCASECGLFSEALLRPWLDDCEKRFRAFVDSPGIRREFATCQLAFGNCYYRMGRATDAVVKLEEALTLFERGGAPEGIVVSSFNLAALYGIRGEIGRAMALLERAERMCASPPLSVMGTASQRHLIQIHSRRGHLYFGNGYFSPAVNNFRTALNHSTALYGVTNRQTASALTQLAHAQLRSGDAAAALKTSLSASNMLTELGLTIELSLARTASLSATFMTAWGGSRCLYITGKHSLF